MTVSIRSLKETDLETADSVLRSAFQRSESWRNDLQLFCELQPDGIFLACQHNTLVGMVAAINYSDYAFVGLMGVRQEFQKRGIGLSLMRHLLTWLQQVGVHKVLLDASPMGQPLYEKLSFIARDEVYVLQRQLSQPAYPRPAETQHLSKNNLDLITAIDMQTFGADRRRLLQALLEIYPERAFLMLDEHNCPAGYIISQENRIGPWVVEDPAQSELLLRAALSLPFRGPVTVVVPGENAYAIDLLQRHGFEIVRVNRHMMRGLVVPPGKRGKMYAQVSLSLG